SGSGGGSAGGSRGAEGAPDSGSVTEELKTRPITASVRTNRSANHSRRSDIRTDSGSSSTDTGRQSQLQQLPDVLLVDSRLDKGGRMSQQGGRQPLLPQHTGLYEEFVPGRDNVICTPGGSSSRSAALLLAIDQRHGSAGADAAALTKASGKRRVTILTPTAPDDLLAAEPPAEQSKNPAPFSFMTRSRTEPKLAASSAGGRPSYISSRDWARLSGAAGGGGGEDGLPALSGEHRLAWPEHCRMDSLARRGFHRSGISISRHLDRYTLIDTVGRGVRVS
uniref:Rhodanese domain-containing protein n=2 Tax=Macrostomum lignano TaxID=282301 RepID=A0A1I8IU65_9PLAT